MARTRSDSLANGKAKLYRPLTRVSPRLAALRSNDAMQIQTQRPDDPVKESVTSILPPRHRAGDPGGSLHCTVSPNQCRKKSNDSMQQEYTNLDQDEALPSAENGGGVDLPKNDVYDALWAMLDAESQNEDEEVLGQWDLDSVLQNWGRIEPDVGPAGPDQGPPPTAI
ncbi:hypothetical protein PIB30_094980 [Stylosanthes scabra]|uniref:Uncharacterized protein n=1 Tax=Stylosanthes scabra TaxID=79078 RepID=A0ABU6ZUG7_9FABA|nr:hypothetical protein [Stylosanthes scabra]